MEPITIRGRYFWQGQDRFVIRGVVYQRHRSAHYFAGDPKDPLAEDNSETVRRSVPLLKELGVNALFVYSINPAKNHDAAMRMLAEAGIYVIVCLGWLQSAPAEHRQSCYNTWSLHRMFAAVDCMAAYTNTLGVALAKLMLVSRHTPISESAPLMRAAARDVKRYMALASETRNQRILPVGFCTEKNGVQFIDEFNYFTRGSPEEAVDFFCFDEYGWAGESSMALSGYDTLTELFAQTRVPVFLSEYGARVRWRPRPFAEARALHGPAMTPVFSGGCAYEFFEAANHYGLARRSSSSGPDDDDDDDDDGALRLRPTDDFGPLRDRLRTARAETPPVTLDAWAGDRAPLPLPLSTAQEPGGSRAAVQMGAMPECPLDWASVRAQVEDGVPFDLSG